MAAILETGQGLGGADLAQFGAYAALIHQAAGQQAALANEVGHKAVGRLMVEVVGAVPLLDAPAVHDADFIGHGKGLVLIVGHQDGGHAFMLEDVAHFQRQVFAQIDIQIGEGLIEQQQLRARRQGTCQGHALLLAAGEFMRILALAAGQVDSRQHLPDARGALGGRQLAQTKADIGGDVEMGKQGVILKHHADGACLGRQHLAGA